MIEPVGEHARKLERDAIVAWLLKPRPKLDDELISYALEGVFESLAEAIERGDHNK